MGVCSRMRTNDESVAVDVNLYLLPLLIKVGSHLSIPLKWTNTRLGIWWGAVGGERLRMEAVPCSVTVRAGSPFTLYRDLACLFK